MLVKYSTIIAGVLTRCGYISKFASSFFNLSLSFCELIVNTQSVDIMCYLIYQLCTIWSVILFKLSVISVFLPQRFNLVFIDIKIIGGLTWSGLRKVL